MSSSLRIDSKKRDDSEIVGTKRGVLLKASRILGYTSLGITLQTGNSSSINAALLYLELVAMLAVWRHV